VRLAAFVSPHGFGHAARTCAVLAALRELDPALRVTLFTSTPRWFFAESLAFDVAFRQLDCDVGLVQRTAVEEDLAATVERLEAAWSPSSSSLPQIASELASDPPDAVLCDIAPLGLRAARDAGVPSVLLENFTWDWIYEPLAGREPRLAPWVGRMRELFSLADLRLQAEPFCAAAAGARAVAPIARRPRSTPAETRVRLGLDEGRPMVLVSMGGVRWRFESFERWRAVDDYDFVVPGGAEREEREGNLRLLPHHSPVHHPDLVAAADVVVGKLGYSTVAEAVRAGTRFLFPPRPDFREHAVLADFVRRTLPAAEITLADLRSGGWIERLPELVERPRPTPWPRDGARETAAAIVDQLSG